MSVRNWMIASAALVVIAGITQRRAIQNMMIGVNNETLQNKNVQAFLKMIRVGEGTADALGYQRLFGYKGGAQFASFADHPRQSVTRGTLTSTAAGAYQILRGTWDEVKASYSLPDFAPHSQDLAAVALVKRRGALLDVIEGRFTDAVKKCSNEWASLPGAPYGQPTVTLASAIDNFKKNGGVIA